jgi:tetratricopeptide (TPR) repeat protein
MIGLLIAAVWWLGEFLEARPRLRPAAVPATLALLLLCAGLARRQVGFWSDNLAVFGRAVAVTSDNALAYNNLAASLRDGGRTEEAIAAYRKAIAAEPANVEAHNNLGLLLAGQGRVEEAVAEYRSALAAAPDDAGAHSNLSFALMRLGQTDESQFHYREADRLMPEYRAEGQYRSGASLAAAGDLRGALERFAEAVRLSPDFSAARLALGQVSVAVGRKDLAREQQEALAGRDPRLARELAAVIASGR